MLLQCARKYFAAILVPTMFLPVYADAQIYKWVDRDGTMQYGDRPPADRKAPEPLAVKSATQANSPALTNWEEKDREFRRRRIERQMQEDKAEATVSSQQRCHAARRRLQILDGNAVYRLNDKGERVYMEDAERNTIEGQARQDIATYCPH